MKSIIGILIFSIMIFSLLANPAPVSIEIADIVLIFLPCALAVISLAIVKNYKVYQPECNVFIAVMLYLSYLLISILIGLMHGVPLLNALRSLGPYVNFFPLLLLGLLPTRLVHPWMIALALIFVGSLQAGYQLYLFLTHTYSGVNTLDILKSRITLIEPRTTLPIILSVTVLPLVLITSNNKLLKCAATAFIFFGLLAGTATLTRSIIISILLGWLAFLTLCLFMQSRVRHLSSIKIISKFSRYFVSIFLVTLLLSMIPKVHMLEQGMLARFYYHASTSTPTDYSNGRLYDEWLPALRTWANSGTISLFFGMGAGNTFTVASGEERTYIHNLMIYSLVYGGVYGLFACVWLYYTVFKTLMLRAAQSNKMIYLGFAALLVSLFSYAQLFAVHKGLAFNAMLFLIITLALCQPEQDIQLRRI